MIIPIASDHAGYPAKEVTKKILEKFGHKPLDFGTDSEDSVDYADFAVKVAERVNNGENEIGILICGSGQGVCMTANKYPKVRAGLVYSKHSAEMTRLHNDANILCLPGRELNNEQIEEILSIWLNTDFEGGRHERRINKIESLTQQ
ncbi:ribose 5-phosphate isomerase B [Gracilimonas sp.]|uniref:ribose 5-phosphate isomerase B n=1 Tax=Gracilimonas sp. TaxID=1974203 RepID=UPI002871AB1C|nr:ribose 5-phosphate isomerase B [Gracilimonas sp.]